MTSSEQRAARLVIDVYKSFCTGTLSYRGVSKPVDGPQGNRRWNSQQQLCKRANEVLHELFPAAKMVMVMVEDAPTVTVVVKDHRLWSALGMLLYGCSALVVYLVFAYIFNWWPHR